MQMKIVLAAVGFYERDIEYNRNKIIKCLKENSGKVDLILFGETFYRGLRPWTGSMKRISIWHYLSLTAIFRRYRKQRRRMHWQCLFGFLEKAGNKIYSSQLTIGADGNILNLFRRVSKGWRESLRMNIMQKEICLQNLNIWEIHFQLVFAAICGMRKMSCR